MAKLINWFEIPVLDMPRAKRFYETLLGIQMDAHDCGCESYSMFPEDETIGGMLSKSPECKPSDEGPILYFDADNKLNEIVSRTEEAGGSIIRPVTKVEVEGRGSFALLKDSEGNRIGLYSE